jgi:hypothetical protein
LLQLRLLQVVGEQSGNTVVLGAPLNSMPLPVSAADRKRLDSETPDTPEA